MSSTLFWTPPNHPPRVPSDLSKQSSFTFAKLPVLLPLYTYQFDKNAPALETSWVTLAIDKGMGTATGDAEPTKRTSSESNENSGLNPEPSQQLRTRYSERTLKNPTRRARKTITGASPVPEANPLALKSRRGWNLRKFGGSDTSKWSDHPASKHQQEKPTSLRTSVRFPHPIQMEGYFFSNVIFVLPDPA